MSGPSELAIAAGVLLDAGLKSTVVLGLGGLVVQLWPRSSAAQRHAVWASTLGVLPLLPLWGLSRGPSIAVDAPWVVAGWAVGALAALLPTLRGLVGLALLQRRVKPGEHGVVWVEGLGGPVTWGLLRPRIALPVSARGWTAANRDAALAHERAHVARHDWAVDVLARVVAALFWAQPLVWLARRRLALEAEHAADDAVLASGITPSTYATLLVSLAQRAGPALALGAASQIGPRVRAVLAPRRRSARRWPVLLLSLLLALFALPALATWPAWTAPPQALTCAPP